MTGKKAKDIKDRKTQMLRIRLSQDDFQRIKDLAAQEGMYISDLVRLKVLGPKPPEPIPAPEPTEITLPGYPGTFKLPPKRKSRLIK